MEIKLNKNNKEKLDKILETKEANIVISDMLLHFFEEDLSNYKIHNERDFLEAFMNTCGFDKKNQNDVVIATKYIGENLKQIDQNIVTENPYFKTVKPSLKKYGNYKLALDHFYPYQGFSYSDIIVDENDSYIEKYCIGYFDKKVNVLALSYKNDIWMNISPNEIITMQPSIDEAFGNVLVLGLGLGYYPFMVSLKSQVSSITVVEKDENIIKIFKDNIYKYFPYKNKIKIVHADAFDYIKTHLDFDYCFVDLWHNPIDGLPLYLEFKKHENKNTKYAYWLEAGIKAMYRRCVLIVLEELLNGSTDNDYKKANNEIDKIINKIYFDNKQKTINCFEEIESLINI